MPGLGTINLHPSLLPKYRGAAPVQWALINGDSETGVTVQMINEELDAGDIVLQEKIEIDENINAGDLYDLVFPTPKPVAWTTFRGHHMKIWKTAVFTGDAPAVKPGEIAKFQKKHLLAGTGSGIIEILEIQPENKKKMDGLSFINGYRLEAGEFFG
jgi:methionyl-tRNA formyltransferase